jgi:hypothetical protein
MLVNGWRSFCLRQALNQQHQVLRKPASLPGIRANFPYQSIHPGLTIRTIPPLHRFQRDARHPCDLGLAHHAPQHEGE